jgi:thioredoxin-like negative regulator of GroEL
MNIVKVNTYQKMLSQIHNGKRHSIIKFSGKNCKACKKMNERLLEIKDLAVDVYDIDHYENKMISRLFSVRMLPTAVFIEDGMPMARMSGLSEADEFLSTVKDVVVHGCQVIDWDNQ